MNAVQPPDHGATWVALTSEPLALEPAITWATLPSCGAVVTFSGTARDHSTGRDGIEALEYEAFDDAARRRLQQVADEARTRWPAVERLVLHHRVGRIELGEAAVVVVAASPHRAEAFEAARWSIDTLKATVPLWKREHWPGGADWALETQPLTDVDRAGTASAAARADA